MQVQPQSLKHGDCYIHLTATLREVTENTPIISGLGLFPANPFLGHDKMILCLANIYKNRHAGCVLFALIFMQAFFFVKKCPYARKCKVLQN